jgi:hypothetical protein
MHCKPSQPVALALISVHRFGRRYRHALIKFVFPTSYDTTIPAPTNHKNPSGIFQFFLCVRRISSSSKQATSSRSITQAPHNNQSGCPPMHGTQYQMSQMSQALRKVLFQAPFFLPQGIPSRALPNRLPSKTPGQDSAKSRRHSTQFQVNGGTGLKLLRLEGIAEVSQLSKHNINSMFIGCLTLSPPR